MFSRMFDRGDSLTFLPRKKFVLALNSLKSGVKVAFARLESILVKKEIHLCRRSLASLSVRHGPLRASTGFAAVKARGRRAAERMLANLTIVTAYEAKV